MERSEMTVSTSNGSEVDAFSATTADIVRAVGSVDDPEYPGVSIVDLGLLERVAVNDGVASVALIPTFSGCPALAIIKEDVEAAVIEVDGVESVSVAWLTTPAWTPDRLSKDGRAALATEFTVAVKIGSTDPACPLCGGPTVEKSMFGPSRCRSVHRCETCRETVEVMRG